LGPLLDCNVVFFLGTLLECNLGLFLGPLVDCNVGFLLGPHLEYYFGFSAGPLLDLNVGLFLDPPLYGNVGFFVGPRWDCNVGLVFGPRLERYVGFFFWGNWMWETERNENHYCAHQQVCTTCCRRLCVIRCVLIGPLTPWFNIDGFELRRPGRHSSNYAPPDLRHN
jgi:hypothetical protein